MRWPVAATIGLSTQIIASAPSGQPSARSLWNSEIFSSSGQPASVTPNGLFLNGIAGTRPSADFFSRQAVRARILALLVAPDAVVRLVERADEIGAGIGQRKAVAPAQMIARRASQASTPCTCVVLERHELQVVELARRAEQHAAVVRGRARRRVRRPRRVAQREVERARRCAASSCCQRVTALANASSRERRRARRGALRARARSAAPSNVAAASALYAFIALRCTNCRLHGVKRRQLVVRAPRARALRRSMPNSAREKVLEMRRERDQQLGFLLARRARRGRARAVASRVGERGVGRAQVRDEQRVDARCALGRVQVGEREAVGRTSVGGSGGMRAACARCASNVACGQHGGKAVDFTGSRTSATGSRSYA